jgi:hypothetical protein
MEKKGGSSWSHLGSGEPDHNYDNYAHLSTNVPGYSPDPQEDQSR